MGSLSESRAIDFDQQKLISYSNEAIPEYNRSRTKAHYVNLCSQTKNQGLSDASIIFRVSKLQHNFQNLTLQTKNKYLSKRFINTNMQYKQSVNIAAIKHGKETKSVPFSAFIEHTNQFAKVLIDLYVNTKLPPLGASPDGIVACS